MSIKIIKTESASYEPLTIPKRRFKLHSNAMYGYIFILPTIGAFLLFSLIPTITVFILSFFKWDLTSSPSFLGIANYTSMFKSNDFWHSLLLTLKYVLYNLPVQFIIAMIVALSLNAKIAGAKWFRFPMLIPWISTPIAIAILWKWLLSPTAGLINYLLKQAGVNTIDFLNTSNALGSIAGVNIWQNYGFTTLLFLVGLQNIPQMYYEAAEIDGSGKIHTFFHITLPMMAPTLMFVFVTGIIGSFQIFDSVYAMTKGGPAGSTKVFYYSIYEQAFYFLNMGYASAMCVILFLILMTLTLLQMRVFSKFNY